ncbi:MAG: glutamate-cysteine ligase family protein [Candidatus Uhrbacteria bacterium]
MEHKITEFLYQWQLAQCRPALRKLEKQITYIPEFIGHMGIEREYFLVDERGLPVPRSPEFLERINDSQWGYELSACQVEHRTPPLNDLDQIKKCLSTGQKHGQQVADEMGCRMVAMEVAPVGMDLSIYPHDQRYAEIADSIPRSTLRAANRITGTHFHIGVQHLYEAVELSNQLEQHLDEMIKLGCHDPERLELYKTMAPNWQPPNYKNHFNFAYTADEQGFTDNLRNCWHLIRISIHGTVEIRCFGVTEDIEEVMSWVWYLLRIARPYLKIKI